MANIGLEYGFARKSGFEDADRAVTKIGPPDLSLPLISGTKLRACRKMQESTCNITFSS